MKKNQFKLIKKPKEYSIYFLSLLVLIIGVSSCKKQLNIVNTNIPTIGGNVNNEAGIAALGLGGVYWNGFNYGDGWLGDSYFSLPWGYHELMGDVIGATSPNNQVTAIGVPDYFILAPGLSPVKNTNPQVAAIIRNFNTPSATIGGNNVLYYEWTNMYAMISACNLALETVGSIPMSTDKINTVKAWAYWWKGYAYAQIGTLYYAGLIENHSSTVVNNYVGQAAIITESNRNLNLAMTTLQAITSQSDYGTMIAELIPKQNQVGLGLPPSSAQWIRTINTMLARNIVLNKLSPFVNGNPAATITKATIPVMTAADWTQVITYCNAGIQKGDYVFTGRSSATNSYFTANAGTAAIMAAGNSTYRLMERFVQQFQTGDARSANFVKSTRSQGLDNASISLHTLLDNTLNPVSKGVSFYASSAIGSQEIYIGPTYEENQLMLAEANIRNGNISAALPFIDAVRTYQGSGLPALAGTTLTLAQAIQTLISERTVALGFRGLSFYDNRRYGWTYDISQGGGRYGATMVDASSTVYTNATISYNFMDYWDVPADETTKNAPAAGSASTTNINY